jgi:hypothetical protein
MNDPEFHAGPQMISVERRMDWQEKILCATLCTLQSALFNSIPMRCEEEVMKLTCKDGEWSMNRHKLGETWSNILELYFPDTIEMDSEGPCSQHRTLAFLERAAVHDHVFVLQVTRNQATISEWLYTETTKKEKEAEERIEQSKQLANADNALTVKHKQFNFRMLRSDLMDKLGLLCDEILRIFAAPPMKNLQKKRIQRQIQSLNLRAGMTTPEILKELGVKQIDTPISAGQAAYKHTIIFDASHLQNKNLMRALILSKEHLQLYAYPYQQLREKEDNQYDNLTGGNSANQVYRRELRQDPPPRKRGSPEPNGANAPGFSPTHYYTPVNTNKQEMKRTNICISAEEIMPNQETKKERLQNRVLEKERLKEIALEVMHKERQRIRALGNTINITKYKKKYIYMSKQ